MEEFTGRFEAAVAKGCGVAFVKGAAVAMAGSGAMCGAAAERVGVALSGGADSVALLMALNRLGFAVTALHCNFSLRGDESDGDEFYCRELCKSLGVEIHIARFDTRASMLRGESIEMACRRLRYDWFERTARDLRLTAIAIAHHREDNIETMMLNLLRGSGPSGLRGMARRRGLYVRPMLDLSRADIEGYLKALGISWRTDSSNLSNDYRRNALRNDILPAIRRYFPNADAGLLNTMVAMKATEATLRGYASALRRLYAEGRMVDVARLASNEAYPEGALYGLCNAMGWLINAETAADIIAARDTSGTQFTCADGLRLELSHGRLRRFSERSAEVYPLDLSKGISHPISIVAERITPEEFRREKKTADELYLDAEFAVQAPQATLRHWAEGDRMKCFGMKGSRKLSDIFSDLKLSVSEKNERWVVALSDEVIWIPGIRTSRTGMVTDNTKEVIKLTVNDGQAER